MKPFYRFARGLLVCILRLSGGRVLGRENIPEDDALLIISNHISLADPPAVSWAYPKQITYIAKEAFARNFFTRTLMTWLGAVFLEKDSNDMAAMRTAMNQLKTGHAVAIYPEGRRHLDQQMGEFKNGAAFIANRCKVKVLPMALVNTGDLFRFWKRNILVNIGEPILPSTAERIDSQKLDEITEEYRQRVEALFQEAVAILEQEGRPMRRPPKKK